MTKLVLTAIGDDREGLVSALSAVVDDHGGNWCDGQFARMSGKFAGIVLIELDEERERSLREAVAGLRDQIGWSVEVSPLQEEARAGLHVPASGEPLQLHLLGQDHPGMVRRVSRALASQGATIDRFRSWTSAAPEGGGVLFEARATVRLPDSTDTSELREALEQIAAELMVDLDLDAQVDGETAGA